MAREEVEARLAGLFGGSIRQPGDVPSQRRPVVWRVDPRRRGALAVLVAVALTATIVGWRVLVDRPRTEAVPAVSVVTPRSPPRAGAARVPGSAGSAGSAVATAIRPSVSPPAASGVVVVDVVGRVRRPGLVRLPAGSRVADAVDGAGGALPGTDLSSLNLARVLVDGEQIGVGRAIVAGSAPSASGAAPVGRTGAPVNLNSATVEQLDALPGVGPVLAQRIVQWRALHGRFQSVDQLNDVSGIGAATFADLKLLVTV